MPRNVMSTAQTSIETAIARFTFSGLLKHLYYSHHRINDSLLRSHARASAVVRDRVFDERFKDCSVHISKLFDVEAALSGRVFPEFGQEGFCLALGQHAVQNHRGFTR